jgi:3-phenylpropionate/trans-cinnamate dioxygenase ferredoxin subunit
MSDFVRVATVHDLTDPGKMIVEVDDRIVVLFLVDGVYSCLDDVCTHDGGPLGEGHLEGTTIACPRHGAKFDIRTGRALTMPATEDTRVHDVKIVGDGVMVRLAGD